MNESASTNYFAWAVAIAAGVLIAYFAIRQYEIYQFKQALMAITKKADQETALMRAQAERNRQQALASAEKRRVEGEEKKRADEEQIKIRRAGDSIGAQLSRQCGEWTRLADGMKKSEYAQQEKVKFCGQLEAYVNFGTPPRR